MPTYNLLPNKFSSKTINRREFDILKKLVVQKSKIPIQEINALLFTHIHAIGEFDSDFNILLKKMQDEIKRWKRSKIEWNFQNCKIIILVRMHFLNLLSDVNVYLDTQPFTNPIKLEWWQYKYTIPSIMDTTLDYDKNYYYVVPFPAEKFKEYEMWENMKEQNITYKHYYFSVYLTYLFNYTKMHYYDLLILIKTRLQELQELQGKLNRTEIDALKSIQKKLNQSVMEFVEKEIVDLTKKNKILFITMQTIQKISKVKKLELLKIEFPLVFTNEQITRESYNNVDFTNQLRNVFIIYEKLEKLSIDYYKMGEISRSNATTARVQNIIDNLMEMNQTHIVDAIKSQSSLFFDYNWENIETNLYLQSLSEERRRERELQRSTFRLEDDSQTWLEKQIENDPRRKIMGDNNLNEYMEQKISKQITIDEDLFATFEKEKFWSCKLCHEKNEPSLDSCKSCEQEKDNDKKAPTSPLTLEKKEQQPPTSPLTVEKPQQQPTTSPLTVEKPGPVLKLSTIKDKKTVDYNHIFYNPELLGIKSQIQYVPKQTLKQFWFNITIDTLLHELNNTIISLIENSFITKPTVLIEGGFASQLHTEAEYTTEDLDMTIYTKEDIDEDYIMGIMRLDDTRIKIFNKIISRINAFNNKLKTDKTKKQLLVSGAGIDGFETGLGIKIPEYNAGTNDNPIIEYLYKFSVYQPDTFYKNKNNEFIQQRGGPLAVCDIKFKNIKDFNGDNAMHFNYDSIFYIETKEHIIKKLTFLINKYNNDPAYKHKIPSWKNQLKKMTLTLTKQSGGNSNSIEQDIKKIRRNAQEIKKLLAGLNN
uniref:RanBP2-type domain-containing protein n=1 Tax=viral metagenome TaxID=1070528 RepID=A0A6C0C2G8_9ZZZZ